MPNNRPDVNVNVRYCTQAGVPHAPGPVLVWLIYCNRVDQTIEVPTTPADETRGMCSPTGNDLHKQKHTASYVAGSQFRNLRFDHFVE